MSITAVLGRSERLGRARSRVPQSSLFSQSEGLWVLIETTRGPERSLPLLVALADIQDACPELEEQICHTGKARGSERNVRTRGRTAENVPFPFSPD
ncbi:hypothetical protein MHYP_G00047110 [Metynnis hypsauchen]